MTPPNNVVGPEAAKQVCYGYFTVARGPGQLGRSAASVMEYLFRRSDQLVFIKGIANPNSNSVKIR